MWWVYALLSALFAASVAIFAKVGMKGVDSDLATAIRTVVILFIAWGIAYFRGATNGIQQLTRNNKLSVALAIIFSVVFLGEALTIKTAMGALCIIGGTLIIVL